MTTTYQFPMFDRLEPLTPWNGGMLAGSDVVTLEDAARFASKHAGTEITPADFLRAAGRGQIPMRAICPRTVTMEPCRETDKPLTMPENCIPTLPLDACKALSSTGRATWRTYDWFESADSFAGALCSFTRWKFPDSEPDILTTPNDCRLTGWDVHKLADAFIEAPAQNTATPAPVGAESASGGVEPDKAGPLPLTTNEIANCFSGFRDWDVKRWKRELGSPDNWLRDCQHSKGTRGRGGYESTWWPVKIALALASQDQKSARHLPARFKRLEQLKPWLEELENNIPESSGIP